MAHHLRKQSYKSLPVLCRILGSCPEATVAALDRSEALGSLAQAIRVQQRDGLPPDLWQPEATLVVSLRSLCRVIQSAAVELMAALNCSEALGSFGTGNLRAAARWTAS